MSHDISKTLKNLSGCLQKIYENVYSINNDNDPLVKSNEDDLIGLVESIENIKMIITKKKEVIKSQLLEDANNGISKEINQRLNLVSSSANYRMNHNLPDYDYQGIMPFSNDRELSNKQEESKVGNMRMNNSSDLHNSQFGQFNRISNYSKAVEQLGDLNLAENESNLFGDENSAKTDNKSEKESIDEGIDFLK